MNRINHYPSQIAHPINSIENTTNRSAKFRSKPLGRNQQ